MTNRQKLRLLELDLIECIELVDMLPHNIKKLRTTRRYLTTSLVNVRHLLSLTEVGDG